VKIWRTIFTNPFLFAELFSFQKLFCLKKKRNCSAKTIKIIGLSIRLTSNLI